MDDGHNCLDETKITRRASRVEQCNEKGRRYKFRRWKERERERERESERERERGGRRNIALLLLLFLHTATTLQRKWALLPSSGAPTGEGGSECPSEGGRDREGREKGTRPYSHEFDYWW